MAGKPKPMREIKQLLILHQQGKSKKTIARTLGMSKNTVKSYLIKLEDLLVKNGKQVSINDLIRLEDPVLEARFHPGNPAYKDDRYDHLKGLLDHYIKELKRTGVSRRLLWEEYRQARPDGYGYSQFCWHLQQHCNASRPSSVLTHQPADKLFIDFAGKKLHYIDKQSGEMIPCQVFVACLPYSDYSFAIAVRSQSTEDFIDALTCCLHDLGGAPAALVPDNLKAAVVKANRYEPGINQILEDFANHYGTVVVPARARKPKDKALVENQVKLIYSRVYAKLRNMQFFDLHTLNEAIAEKVKDHNQTRMQQKPWCREEKFLAEERKLLTPLPEQPFELKNYKELKVAQNNHIYLSEDKHYYSVPYALIGRKVKMIYTKGMVYVFSKGQQVAVHIRSYHQGGYTSNPDHLCSQQKHYLNRSPKYYQEQAAKKSRVLYELITLIFSQNKYPEQLYRTCDGLFALHRQTDTDRFEKACQMAIDYQNYSYRFILNILENNMMEQQSELPDKPLPKHHNLRGKAHYQNQLQLNFIQTYESN